MSFVVTVLAFLIWLLSASSANTLVSFGGSGGGASSGGGAGCYTANQVVPYDRFFHDDTGTLVDPTSPTATLRITPFGGTSTFCAQTICAGAQGSLPAVAKLNSETGRYGGEYTVGASPTIGTYEITVKGTVPTAKSPGAVATAFYVKATC